MLCLLNEILQMKFSSKLTTYPNANSTNLHFLLFQMLN